MIDQLDIQRRGGICLKWPTACVVRDLLVDAGVVKPSRVINVVDLTYGRGIFWLALPQARVFAFDVRKLDWVRPPYVFYNDNCVNWWKYLNAGMVFDVVAVDPPWSQYDHRLRPYYKARDVYKILDTALQVTKVYNAYLLVHYKECWVPNGTRVLSEVMFQGRSRYIRQPKPSWFGVLVLK